MTILKPLAILLSVGATTLPGVALAEVIDCKMDPGFNRWYIAPVIRVEIGEGGTVKVRDDLIKSTGRKSVFGKVAKDSDIHLLIAWELPDPPEEPSRSQGSLHDPHLLIRLTLKRPALTATLAVDDIAQGGQSYRATGKCSVVE